MEIEKIVNNQREYFKSGQTMDVDFRLEQLKKLKTSIKLYEKELFDSFMQDLNKCEYDVLMTELMLVNQELDLMIKKLRKYTKTKRVKISILNPLSGGRIVPEPYGTVLIVSPWNYPFQLAMIPLIGAMGAGNTVVLKPSSSTPNVSATIKKMLSVFDEKYVAVINGSREETAGLFDCRYDFAFFTGGANAGRELYQKLSHNLTPCVLELGGKSPAIIDFDADLKQAVKRCVWGKFLNAGQTCVAPDYFLVHETVKDKFVEMVKQEIRDRFYLEDVLTPNFVSIVNEKQKARIEKILDHSKVVCGGEFDGLTLHPTVMDNVTEEDPIMQEEVFAPIMPIVPFRALKEELDKLTKKEKPLALYYFSTDEDKQKQVLATAHFGGGCINDCILHLTEHNLPFGGVGASGMGNYHGKKTFDTFTHYKSVLVNNTKINLWVKFMPYTRKKLKFLRWFIKHF